MFIYYTNELKIQNLWVDLHKSYKLGGGGGGQKQCSCHKK